MCACVCACALMRDGEKENEIDLIGYNCQNSAVTRLIDSSSHSSELGSSLGQPHSSHIALSTYTASRLFPDQQELGMNPTPYASNDSILIITSLPCVLLKSQNSHLA